MTMSNFDHELQKTIAYVRRAPGHTTDEIAQALQMSIGGAAKFLHAAMVQDQIHGRDKGAESTWHPGPGPRPVNIYEQEAAARAASIPPRPLSDGEMIRKGIIQAAMKRPGIYLSEVETKMNATPGGFADEAHNLTAGGVLVLTSEGLHETRVRFIPSSQRIPSQRIAKAEDDWRILPG